MNAKVPRDGLGYRAAGSFGGPDGVPIYRWRREDVSVCSSRGMAEHRSLLLPQFCVSVVKAGRRADDDTVRSVLADFDMEDAREDNHFSGTARCFWLVDGVSKHEQECPCKETEETVKEPDGYEWQKAPDV